MSLSDGDAGVSGISGNSISSSSCRGEAPRAAGIGELRRGLGRGVSIGRIRREAIQGGLGGLGAGEGVEMESEAVNVLTITSWDASLPGKVDTVVMGFGD